MNCLDILWQTGVVHVHDDVDDVLEDFGVSGMLMVVVDVRHRWSHSVAGNAEAREVASKSSSDNSNNTDGSCGSR